MNKIHSRLKEDVEKQVLPDSDVKQGEQPSSQTSQTKQASQTSQTKQASQTSQTKQASQKIQTTQTAQITQTAPTVKERVVSKLKITQIEKMEFESTAQVPIPDMLIDSILGQDDAVALIKKAAKQRRHVLLVGEPGTGKSMLGLALAQMLPKEQLQDILSFQNPNDENQPLIRVMPAGQGRQWVNRVKQETSSFNLMNVLLFMIPIVYSIYYWWQWQYNNLDSTVYAASLIVGVLLFVGLAVMISIGRRFGGQTRISVPKIVVDNADQKSAPFFDATGAHAGALLGDVLHDPFQSGGLGTPAHERVVAGMIHKANNGVLFVDEIATLGVSTQQELLTAIQEGKFAITGQSERSAGAMVRTEAVPCNFILVAAGNLDTVEHMHPALRSRIRGYGYEVYMRETMPDTPTNRAKIIQFIAQEVTKDKKIPHFSKLAVMHIIEEARRRANRKGHLTLRLRDLGGLIRAAGDVAQERKATLVEIEHILAVKTTAATLEGQIAQRIIERKREYEVIQTKGSAVGRVNGLAVIGDGSSYSGILLPIEAEVTNASEHDSMRITATGKLGDIAKEAITNVSAIIKKRYGKDLDKHAVFVQFLQTYEGVEGDSASIAVAVAMISALTDAKIRQDTAITGSLSVRGTVLPIGGATYKIEAAIEAGISQVIIPKSNLQDVVLSKALSDKIRIVAVSDLEEVFDAIFEKNGKNSSADFTLLSSPKATNGIVSKRAIKGIEK